jgi:Flp pilus assembly protein TadG
VTRFCGNRVHALRDEAGQALVLVALSMIVLIGFVGLAIDVGSAYFTQRELQKAADAAALAGAQELPNSATATAVARQYGAADGDKNEATLVKDATMAVSTRCVTSLGCVPSRGVTTNVIAVTETAQVPTLFAKLLGFDSFTVHAKATACSPCSAKPLDIMVVLDRTGSMCQLSLPNGTIQQDPACTDLGYAKDGVRTFLSFFDESLDRIGLAVFPPTPANPSQAQKCAQPPQNPNRYGYDNPTQSYVIEPLSSSFSSTSSPIQTTLADSCLKANGTTNYADAIEAAQAELEAHGRPDAQNVIVFFSDGAANTSSSLHPQSSLYWTSPCRQGVASAAAAKAAQPATLVYSIGYDLDGGTGSPERCKNGVTGANDPTGITAYDAIVQIASAPENFYKRDAPGSLNMIFSAIATDISSLNARLVSDDVS